MIDQPEPASQKSLEPAIRAVVDTSSLVPAMQRRELQQAAQLGMFTAIWSPWIIAELNRVLVWRWIKDAPATRARGDLSDENEKRCGEAANRMMEWLLSCFEVVAPVPPYPPAWETLSDAWDHPVWAAAIAGQARYVISENTHHYPPRGPDERHIYQGVEYLPGRAFLDMLTEGIH